MRSNYFVILPALVMALSVATVSWSAKELSESQNQFAESVATRESKARLLIGLLGAESSQRGFLLTGRKDYLAPYFDATELIQAEMKALTERNLDVSQRKFVNEMKPQIAIKLDEMRRSIDVRRQQGASQAANSMIKDDDGKNSMDDMRSQMLADQVYSSPLRNKWLAQSANMTTITLYSGLAAIIAVMFLVGGLVKSGRVSAKEHPEDRHNGLDGLPRPSNEKP